MQRGVGVPEVRPLSRGRGGPWRRFFSIYSPRPRVTEAEIRTALFRHPPSAELPDGGAGGCRQVVGEHPERAVCVLSLCAAERARQNSGATWRRRFRAPSRRRRRRGAGGRRSGSSSRSGRPWPCGRGVGRLPPLPRPPGPPRGAGPLPATAGGDPLAAAGDVDRRGLTGRHRRRRSIIIPNRHRRGQLRHLPEPHHGAVHRVPGESGRARPTRAGSPPSATDPGGAPSTRRRRLRSPTSCGRSARRPGGCATTRSTSTAFRGGSRPGRCARCAASSGSSRSTAAEPRPERRSWRAGRETVGGEGGAAWVGIRNEESALLLLCFLCLL